MEKCAWALAGPLEEQYHDLEWGVAVHDDRLLFELLILEGAQAGLSWNTILKKRAGYKKAFDDFDAETMAGYEAIKIDELLANPDIVRNRLKVHAAVSNARVFLKVRQEFGTFNDYIWQFVDGRPVRNAWISAADIPVRTPVSDLMSKDMKRRGFKFVGSTICYAYMQAVGMVNDHTINCFRYGQI